MTAGIIDEAEIGRITDALSALKAVMTTGDRDRVQALTRVLNQATQHLAEVMMNTSVRAALAGRNVKDV